MVSRTLAKRHINCAVIYLVYRTHTGKYSKMLTSKTRVAPLKELSIPRLELGRPDIGEAYEYCEECALFPSTS